MVSTCDLNGTYKGRIGLMVGHVGSPFSDGTGRAMLVGRDALVDGLGGVGWCLSRILASW